ncbi:serine hydrolase domain-containing protein [Streptomyces massasporeus]|uniref:serine hydrolase domain-containing protein n=1 Tax=Streptomyces massasporeus TaxID=67324 RepID=UPI003719DE3B
MTTRPLPPWPGEPGPLDTEDALRTSDVAPSEVPPDDRLLADAVTASDAPDVVFALSRHGRRTVMSGGTASPPPLPREDLRYEIGSATKTFTGLLLARLIHDGALSGGEPATTLLDGGRPAGATPVTLAHLITHTSGLPALPAGFFLRGLPAWHTNPYARFPASRVVDAYLRHRRRHRPGTRWCYSNYGVAVLGHALAAATGTPWEDLVTGGVLRPLGLDGTTLRADGSGLDAVGRGRDGETPVPPFDAGGFQAAGAVRATPYDLLAFLEAHLYPGEAPPELAPALRAVRRPVLRRGLTHRHVHTVAWFRHPTDGGPLYFHSGATLGQQAFLGFRPDTGTALAAVCTRRFRAHDPFVATAYAVLAGE